MEAWAKGLQDLQTTLDEVLFQHREDTAGVFIACTVSKHRLSADVEIMGAKFYRQESKPFLKAAQRFAMEMTGEHDLKLVCDRRHHEIPRS